MDAVALGMRRDMESAGRIVVISADIGAGHDAAAAELTRRLRGRGFVVDRLNFLAVLPRPARWVFREAYRGILRWLPWGYDPLFAPTSRSRLSVSVLRALLRPFWGRMRHRSHRPLVDSVGDAVAVVAALLQSTGGLR